MDLLNLLERLDNAIADRGNDSVRTIALHLESMAATKERKAAIRRLKNAGSNGDLVVIASAVRSVFLSGTIGDDGWPRK